MRVNIDRADRPAGRDGHSIRTPASGHEHELAASAQTVDSEKHLVPRKIGTLPHDLFQVAGLGAVQHVDHLIFRSRMLCHAPPLGKQKELL